MFKLFRKFEIVSLCLCAFSVMGCGTGTTHTPVTLPPIPPATSIKLISFDAPKPAGSVGFTGSLIGSGFTSTSIVYWNGSAISTSFQSDTILYPTVPASLLAHPGGVMIQVIDNGVASNKLVSAVLSPAAVGAGVISLISVAPGGTATDGDTLIRPSISRTGRFVSFQSSGTTLVSQRILTPWSNIYLRDTCAGIVSGCTPSTQLVSVSADGLTGGNYQSRESSVSADGRYVAFDSGATNLLSPNPSFCTNAANCVYVRDTCTGASAPCTPQTFLGSSIPPDQPASGALPSLSATGRFLAFTSNGSGLVESYVRDLCTGASQCNRSTVLVSTNAIGGFANEGARYQAVSDDGRIVAFESYSTNLIDPNAPAIQSKSRMFARDTCIGALKPCVPVTTRVDALENGADPNMDLAYDVYASVSSTGRYVAFSTNATDLSTPNQSIYGTVYRRDICVGVSPCVPGNTLISVANDGSYGNGGSHAQEMSGDGRYVVFTSLASNLTCCAVYPPGSRGQIFVRDTCTGATTPCDPSTVQVDVLNTPYLQTAFGGASDLANISADGHYVVFTSSSKYFTPAGSSGHTQVFLASTGF